MAKQLRRRDMIVSIVVVEYHEHQPVTVTVGGKSIYAFDVRENGEVYVINHQVHPGRLT
jgi:hypothetical protein